jgi:hypothetical protein
MLVSFTCPTCPEISLFGDVAVRLLKMMGHSATVPGALAAEDVRPARERLEAAIGATEQGTELEEPENSDDGEPAVGLALRAWPLIELLKTAEKAKSHVMWDKSHV